MNLEYIAKGAIERLIAQRKYRVDADDVDCQVLISMGPASLTALCETVRGAADTWVVLNEAMGTVAEALGEVGRDRFSELLAQADEDYDSRIVTFLEFAAEHMSDKLYESLCDRVHPAYATAFGDAAVCRREGDCVRIIIKRLCAAPAERVAALQALLTATFAATWFCNDDREWEIALVHADPRVRAAAVANPTDDLSKEDVLALADDADESVRYSFVLHTKYLPDSILMRMSADNSPRVRAAAVWRLGRDLPELKQVYERLLEDPHPAVSLMAALSLEHPSLEEKLLSAFDSADPILRECAVRGLGFLPPEKYGAALAQIENAGRMDELAEAVESCDEDELEVLKSIAALALRNPPIQVLRAVSTKLAFSDCAGAADIAAELLSIAAPARVRRAGFHAVSRHLGAWARHLLPLLHPDEPLVNDLISQLEGALREADPIDRPFYEQLKKRFPGTPIERFAGFVLARQ